MQGVLIYDSEGYKRNRWFAQRIIELVKEKTGVELQLRIYDGLNGLPKVDFAIVRAIAPEINAYYERVGTAVINNAQTSKIANDKWLTYKLCRELNITVMPTELCEGECTRTRYPYVLKSLDGHGGKQVHMITCASDLRKVNGYKRYITQDVCSKVGYDMRVYVVGDKPLCAVLRHSESDFRSNFSLGGSFERVEIDENQRKIIEKLYDYLKFDFVGIDFIFDNGRWVLNEIEDSVGCRMLYELGIDPLPRYIDRIKSRI